MLLVDDAPFVREILERILTAAGHCCATAEGGKAGLLAAESGSFDVVITDHEMPDLDGCTLIERLRNGEGPNQATPMILLSGYIGDEALTARATAVGVDAVLGKPIVVAEVMSTLARLVPVV
ncbi:MAG: response regulator [Methylacidiphilales bacterium]|nr:response regulator [Candidatus Methylacidiphilales bacterium]